MRKRLHVLYSTDRGRMPLVFVSHSSFLTLSFTRQTVSYTRRSNKGYVFNIHIYISYNHTCFSPFFSRIYKITKSHSFNRKFRIQASIMILLRGEMWRMSITCMYLHTDTDTHTHTYARTHARTMYSVRTLYVQMYRIVAYLHEFAVSRSKYLHKSKICRERDSLMTCVRSREMRFLRVFALAGK